MCAALAAWPRLKESTTDFFGAIFWRIIFDANFFFDAKFLDFLTRNFSNSYYFFSC